MRMVPNSTSSACSLSFPSVSVDISLIFLSLHYLAVANVAKYKRTPPACSFHLFFYQKSITWFISLSLSLSLFFSCCHLHQPVHVDGRHCNYSLIW
ncbi:hypothetical protein B0T24DRAFT_128390 [Lasiosphaeria ovina]|uniref:Uncharacterized protein n=1 Tax=Lasiosphaeria ovina TaxID=92902 RepID=A0AAE0MXN5_9PEZI|nr:hypothetical protein B0T24DRAFT_128390 [Lasiosphaeria ovina]